jgi:fatty-acyl-CoA synthase
MTVFVDLISAQRKLNVNLPEIAIANTAGAICTPQLAKDIQSYLNVKKVRSMYGLTETTSACFQSLPQDTNEMMQHSVGLILDNIEAKVIDKNENIVPFGERGELCIRGYLTLMDYYDDDERTKEVLGVDKWFRTGDQFILFENGYGQIVGRIKEMIIRGGENIYPKEIEDFLNTHENVMEAHVIGKKLNQFSIYMIISLNLFYAGIADTRMGEEMVAFVRLNDPSQSFTRDDVKLFCDKKLSHFKIPRHIVIVNDFPRTLSGKVQKFRFTEYFSEQLKEIA